LTPFSRDGSGLLSAVFSANEADIVADLAAQIAGMLGDLAGDDSDPLFQAAGIGGSSRLPADSAVARLLPDAYGTAGDASEFRQLTERSLAARKVSNARTVIDSLAADGGRVSLDPAAAQAWLRTLSDIRLTIASRLGIEQDGDEGATDTPAARALHDLYDWLAWVTETLLEAVES
jgi:hypothetical protein